MAGITLAQAQAALDRALAAHASLLEGGTRYRWGEAWIECPPLIEVEQSIERWNTMVERLSAGTSARGPRIFGVRLGD